MAQRSRGVAIADLTALRDIGGSYAELALSTDGTMAAVVERRTDLAANDYRYAVIAIDTASGRAREVGDAGRFVLRSDSGRHAGVGMLRRPQFSADGRHILYLREYNGAVEIWRAAIDGSGAATLVRAEGDIRRFSVDRGRVLYETSTPRAALAADADSRQHYGFAIDERFTPSYSLTPMPEIDRDVRRWIFDLASLESTAATPEQTEILDVRPAPHVRPLDPELRADEPPIGVFDVVSNVRCPDAACSGAITNTWELADLDGARAIVFRRQEGPARRLTSFYVWRPDANTVRRVMQTDARTEGCAPSATQLVCLQDTAFQPRRVVSIDWRTGRARPLYDPNPQFASMAHPRIERFEYSDAEGNESFANLIYPLSWRAGRSYPLVISQYRSRGFLLGATGDETPILPLSANGYFVLDFDRPEFRERGQRMTMGAIQREVELAGIERGAKREALNVFIARAVERGADRDRTAITGLSDGAETLYWMLLDEPFFSAAVVSSPPIDPISYSLQSPATRAFFDARGGPTGPWDDAPEPWRTWWRNSSPVFHAERIGAPILFNLSEAEALRAFPLITRLRERHAPYDAYLYPGAYHLKWRPAQIEAAQQRTLDWIDFWLQGVEREDTSEPGRLERWRQLRTSQVADSP
ncbi:MAG: Atxe2 family lasso peptide isopeptidase [Terricaulis sp.]